MDSLKAVDLVHAELIAAKKMFPPMTTLHYGYAVILEELDELWDEIKKKQPDTEILRKEARQVAAMALRFLVDLVEEEGG